MELKPIKEKKETLYPTIKEESKSNFMKGMFLATTGMSVQLPMQDVIYAVAIPSYVAEPSYAGIQSICKLIRYIAIIITIISAILLFVNKKKINKSIVENENANKLKKSNKVRKMQWWIFGISIFIIVISSLVRVYLTNYM